MGIFCKFSNSTNFLKAYWCRDDDQQTQLVRYHHLVSLFPLPVSLLLLYPFPTPPMPSLCLFPSSLSLPALFLSPSSLLFLCSSLCSSSSPLPSLLFLC